MWLTGHCDMYGGEEKWIQNFWWGKVKETDRLADEQIKSHDLCKRTDPSVAKAYTRQTLVFISRYGLSVPRGKNSRYPNHKAFLSSSTEQGAAEN